MLNPSSKSKPIQLEPMLQIMGNIQRLTVKAFGAKNRQNLIFIIINDTYFINKYDRAILFSKIAGKVRILGISGQETFNLQTELASRLKESVQKLKNSSNQRVLNAEDFSACPEHWKYIQALRSTTVCWIPFDVGNEEIGLWLEKYDDPEAEQKFNTEIINIKKYLVPAYAAAWSRINRGISFHKILPHVNMKKVGLFSLLILILLFIIPIRLRIVAPCTVLPDHPYIVTAPMDGIVDHIAVNPGEEVHVGQTLFEYDKKIPLIHYKTALDDVDLVKSELNSAYVLGIANVIENSKLTKLTLELKNKENLLAYAERQLKLLVNTSPVNGLANINEPAEWRGKPVKHGENIMTISNPKETRLGLWIPEKNIIQFASDIPITAFFNSIPTQTFKAKLMFITPEVKINEELVPGYNAEAEWLNPEESPKLGLKGYAFIYGERVSLFYYLMRRPISAIHKFLM